MRTVQEIYDEAIHLIDAQNENSGSTNTPDTREYAVRAAKLLSTLLNEAYPYSDTYPASTNGRRPVHPPVTEMTDNVDMDDFICLSALPAGLAALFVFDEDKDKYNAFWGDYVNRLQQAARSMPTSGFEDVENPYAWEGHGAGIEYGQFGSWPW